MSAEVSVAGVTAVVLCGGTGRRFGGDKTQALIDGVPVLDHVVGQLPPSWPVVCVGPARPTVAPVTWVREEPPGGDRPMYPNPFDTNEKTGKPAGHHQWGMSIDLTACVGCAKAIMRCWRRVDRRRRGP